MYVEKGQIEQIIRLSAEAEYAEKIFSSKYFPYGVDASEMFNHRDTTEYEKCVETEKKLIEYIKSLSYDAVLDVEALMTYGREIDQYGSFANVKKLVSEDFFEDNRILDSSESFSLYRRNVEDMYPSESGIAEAAAYLSEKPLSRYLKHCLEIFF